MKGKGGTEVRLQGGEEQWGGLVLGTGGMGGKEGENEMRALPSCSCCSAGRA